MNADAFPPPPWPGSGRETTTSADTCTAGRAETPSTARVTETRTGAVRPAAWTAGRETRRRQRCAPVPSRDSRDRHPRAVSSAERVHAVARGAVTLNSASRRCPSQSTVRNAVDCTFMLDLLLPPPPCLAWSNGRAPQLTQTDQPGYSRVRVAAFDKPPGAEFPWPGNAVRPCSTRYVRSRWHGRHVDKQLG